MSIDFDRLQAEQAEWSARNFGAQPSWHMVLGLIEEVGELAHAQLSCDPPLEAETRAALLLAMYVGRFAHATLKRAQKIRGRKIRKLAKDALVQIGRVAYNGDADEKINSRPQKTASTPWPT